MRKRGETVGIVDFGSREIRVLIARQDSDGMIQVLGHGSEPSRACISQGVIQDLNAAQVALKKAVASAEKEAQVNLTSLFCGVNGKNVDTFIREGKVKIEQQVVDNALMNAALDIASHDILAPGKRVTSSVTAQEWYVDDLRVMDPVGIRGQVLKTRVHFALIPMVIIDNLITCVNSQGLELEDFIFTPLASAQGCLTPEEMELGVAVLDMGRSTTGLAVYRDYSVLGTQCFEWGGYHLTRDVAAGLHVSFAEADELIMSYGISNDLMEADPDADDASLPPSDKGGTPLKLKSNVHGTPSIVSRAEVEAIIFERGKELMTKVRQFLQTRGLMKHLVCGVVLTGGASEIKNNVELADSVLQVAARQGCPTGVEILPQAVRSASYCAAVGVVRHAFAYRAAARSGRIDTDGPGMPLLRRMHKSLKKYFF